MRSPRTITDRVDCEVYTWGSLTVELRMTNSNTKVPSGRDRETRNGNIMRKQQARGALWFAWTRSDIWPGWHFGARVRFVSRLEGTFVLLEIKPQSVIDRQGLAQASVPRSVGLRVSPDDDAYEPPRVIVESIASRDTLAVWRMLAR